MRELRAGLWQWQAPHPEWTPEQRWPQQVSSCAIDDGERLVLFDPLAVPETLLALAQDREPVIVLTAPWHERDTRTLVERLDAAVFAPLPDTGKDLIKKYGITPEQAGDGSPDLKWLRSSTAKAHWYGAGDRLTLGIQAGCRSRSCSRHMAQRQTKPPSNGRSADKRLGAPYEEAGAADSRSSARW